MDNFKHQRDPLEKRLAEFLAPAGPVRSIGGVGTTWVGTNLGSVRKDNQDRVAVVRITYEHRARDNTLIAVLADGIGGLSNGAEAAVSAASAFIAAMIRSVRLPLDERLRTSANRANAAVYDSFGGRSGSTLSAVCVNASGACAVNVGDSRIYGVEAGGDVVQVSKDDTLGNYVNFSDSVREGRNALVQYVGMGEGVEPHILEVNRSMFGRFLLTSDGVHGVGGDIFSRVAKSSQTGQELVRKLLTLNDISGGSDNGSVATLELADVPQAASDEGINIRVFAPADRLEIWIPTSQILQERSEPAPFELEYRSLMDRYQAVLRQLEKPKKRPSKEKAGKPQSPSEEKSSPTLPLDEEKPEPKISFPEKRD